MSDKITLTGKIVFSPEEKTKKHINHSSWKKVAMVMFDGEITQYYTWFLNRRYNLILNPPQRGGHISFINDSIKDISLDGVRTNVEVEDLWLQLKNKWDNKLIETTVSLIPWSNGEHWWLPIPHEDRELLHGIRAEIGLGRPYWGLHLTLGYANERNIEHSKYIYNLIKRQTAI